MLNVSFPVFIIFSLSTNIFALVSRYQYHQRYSLNCVFCFSLTNINCLILTCDKIGQKCIYSCPRRIQESNVFAKMVTLASISVISTVELTLLKNKKSKDLNVGYLCVWRSSINATIRSPSLDTYHPSHITPGVKGTLLIPAGDQS